MLCVFKLVCIACSQSSILYAQKNQQSVFCDVTFCQYLTKRFIYCKKTLFLNYFSQLNGTTVGDVNIKVSIARKQPLLDAATGKSVWASLGK